MTDEKNEQVKAGGNTNGAGTIEMDLTKVIEEVESWNLGVVRQDPIEFANLVTKFIHAGSKSHILTTDDIIVYAYPKDVDITKYTGTFKTIKHYHIPTNLTGLMNLGAKYLDAKLYISLPEDLRPPPKLLEMSTKDTEGIKITVYNDFSRLKMYMYVFYFYMLIRAHPPSSTGIYAEQPMPKFIRSVLKVEESPGEIADYLAEFPLAKLDPSWIKKVPTCGLTQETASKLGLVPAGYRLALIFNCLRINKYDDDGLEIIKSKKMDTEKKEITDPIERRHKPSYLDTAVLIARSFRNAGYCWDFHPATRNPNISAKRNYK
ncbi:hypothetical protein Golomagni_05487 [Golovinomyces magnicellulatus]|nr:hypothetical protein Golomagni_05487 [Golovinomyces magnicellulatus]